MLGVGGAAGARNWEIEGELLRKGGEVSLHGGVRGWVSDLYNKSDMARDSQYRMPRANPE